MKHITSVISGFALLISTFALLMQREVAPAPALAQTLETKPTQPAAVKLLDSNLPDDEQNNPFVVAPELRLNNGKLVVDKTTQSLRYLEQQLRQQQRELRALRAELEQLKQHTAHGADTTQPTSAPHNNSRIQG